jgi:hypothetical protein
MPKIRKKHKNKTKLRKKKARRHGNTKGHAPINN